MRIVRCNRATWHHALCERWLHASGHKWRQETPALSEYALPRVAQRLFVSCQMHPRHFLLPCKLLLQLARKRFVLCYLMAVAKQSGTVWASTATLASARHNHLKL